MGMRQLPDLGRDPLAGEVDHAALRVDVLLGKVTVSRQRRHRLETVHVARRQ
jgi:hypothetical protein